jgi:predicted dehydrogenase/nucleoside-diphosphate-sugar epimerase
MRDTMQPSTDDATGQAGNPNSASAGRSGGTRRVALVGAGYIADWHAQSLRTVKNVELVAVCDPALARAQALAEKFDVPHVYVSLERMLNAEQLDAVHVLAPPNRHFELARTVLEAGVNVFLEKPMCDHAADCEALARLAGERGLRLGVGHNFLFAEPYEQLRRDVRSGVLGRIDDVRITWHRPLPQAAHGPFDAWMLRDPRNILVEVGSHSVAHMLDLVGEPYEVEVWPTNPIELPTGQRFYRRWQVNGYKGQTAVELRFSFVPGFGEYTIHVRGSLAAATVDFERNTYTLDEHLPRDPDFDSYAMIADRAKSLKRQARRSLREYVLSKMHLCARGNPYGASIARAMDAFYDSLHLNKPLDERVDGRTGAKVIWWCEELGERANLAQEEIAARPEPATVHMAGIPRILVLGGTGFIGRELVRQLIASGYTVRLLARSAAGIPAALRASGKLDCQIGDVANRQDLLRAMEGMECVFHLARANVKSWADYQKLEIDATRRVGECVLEAGVLRLIYTGTIDSYYGGRQAGTITEATPLDPGIKRRNLYARAKAESEEILMRMHQERGLPVVIVRPGVVIGRGGNPFHWGVGMWWNDSVCQMWGEGNNKLALVLVEDVARALTAAMEKPGIEGSSFNLVGDPCLSAREYLDELDRAGRMRIQRYATPILRFYLTDLMKWVVKVAVGHKERQIPSYRDWESRSQGAVFDCTAAKTTLGWEPVCSREELVRRGIEEPLREYMR